MAKPIKDITKVLSQIAKDMNMFPKDVTIKSAKIEIDDWGTYYVSVDYEMDGLTFNVTQRVFGDLSGAVNSALGIIKETYDTLHQLEHT
jgi:hypothetical protein